MDKIGLLFPGQGSQFIGMGRDLYNGIVSARKLMDNANEILGFDLRSLIFDGREEELTQTEIAQPAIYSVSAMYLELFKRMGKSFKIVAGHSLGEYSALYAAGVLSFEDGLRLVAKRGLAMSRSNNLGTMYAVMGVPLEEIEKYVGDYNGKVVIANINSKNQIVISGHTEETEKMAKKLSEIEDSKVKQLNVSGAFHSPLMKNAKDVMDKEINLTGFKSPIVDVVPNVLGYATNDIDIIKDSLIEQISGRVEWLDTILHMKEMGINQLYEVGPGDVLKKLNQTITFKPKCSGLEL